MDLCPVCGREAPVEDGVFGVHYNSGLLQCPNSRQSTPDAPEPEPPRKAPAKRAAKSRMGGP